MKFTLLVALIVFVGCGVASPDSQSISVVTAVPTTQIATDEPTAISVRINEQEACDIEADTVDLTDYTPTSNQWVVSNGSQLLIDESPFTINGINYYPRMSPFDLFLTDTEADVMGKELDVIVPTGINTLRIFINLNQLFLCDSNAIPNTATFTILDSIIQTIGNKNLHAIVVLHQTIDDPEQTSWQQLQFLVARYRNEPTILAWDILENGDKLYDELTSEVVLTWLASAIQASRQMDNQHLITASWQSHTHDTIEWVDIVSFQHFEDYQSLRQNIANLKSLTDKPILLSAIGFSTFDLDETAQRNLLFQAMEEARNNDLAGWGIYMAFDYPTSVTCEAPNCPADATSINYYGIWNTSYFPKLAVDAVKRVTGVTEE